MNNFLTEIADILCSACKGRCCASYPLFLTDENDDLRMGKPVYILQPKPVLAVETKIHGKGCDFYPIGGCPEMVKPDECKEWFCEIIDSFIFDGKFHWIWTNHSPQLRSIYRLLKKVES